jgi:23S rRNA (cytidine1920-2'-O)/16S rRNA (cytidine1409-2'-O)-methyltransferase
MGAKRLDIALVARGLARSRTHAARLIADHRVRVAGAVAGKPATPVDDDTALAVDLGDDWASRGAYKLIGALDTFDIDVQGRRALDAGASHGGFTDVLLRRGAIAVAAVDVGLGQLVPRVAADPRVHVHDHTNIRELDAERTRRILDDLGGPAQLIVADLSFISLTLVLPQLLATAEQQSADVLPMVKPQFEVGKGRLGAHGVVHDPALRRQAVFAVAQAAAAAGWGLRGVTPSPLPGPSGNVEYFLHLRADAPIDDVRAEHLIREAVEGGPQ